ncbi:histidine kinase [Chloroflexota bacterium]
MTIQKILSRLDKSIATLRWLLVGSVLLIAFSAPLFVDDLAGQRNALLASALLGVAFAFTGSVLAAWEIPSNTPAQSSFVLDIIFALLVFWAANEGPLLLILVGAFPVIMGTLRFDWRYGVGAAGILFISTPLIYAITYQLQATPGELALGPLLLANLILLLVSIFVSVPIRVANMSWTEQAIVLRERQIEAGRLRAAREHSRAVYEMAATLSATLDYEAVLDAALDVGVLGLREMGPNARLVSAVLLFDKDSGDLKIVNARRLTHADMTKRVTGRKGVIGKALKQAEPVFASDARQDPELRYFVAFQDARSILCVPLRAGYDSYGVLVFGSVLPNIFNEDHIELLTVIASQATIALKNATLYQDLLEEKERIIEVEEDARKKLSRDLHDGPTQSVAAIAMRVNYIRRLLERNPDQVPPELQKVEELARKTSKEIRHMLFTLRPLILETQGLAAALAELAKKIGENYEQNIVVQVQPQIDQYIDNNDQNVLFNIADECINNARKHAEAEHIWVRLSKQDNYLLLEVQDDGVGFDIGEVDANYDQRGSLGMINLRERAELLDGRLRIESEEGKGTKISLIVAIDRHHPSARPEEAEVDENQTPMGTIKRATRKAGPRPPQNR